MKNKICIISGPTASGKTSTSLKLAELHGGEIINFDSLLFYNELNIGTAKPTIKELELIPHHMINISSIKTPINAADYIKKAFPLIKKLLLKNKIIFLVGGSGFYLRALLFGMYESITTPAEIQEKSNILYKTHGIDPFLKILEEKDKVSFNRLHPNDHYRIRRAVEHFWVTNSPFSKARENLEEKKNHNLFEELGYNIFHLYLDLPKEEHQKIIEKRTAKMLEDGLLEEVKDLLKRGFSGEEKPLKSIGYKEMVHYLKSASSNEEELTEAINIATRQLAKAQRTWFKKIDKHSYHPLKDQNKIENDLRAFLLEDN